MSTATAGQNKSDSVSVNPDLVIQTHNLGRQFGRRWAVRELNLSVPRGSVFGFLGLNGAGKSTTMRMLMGLLTPHSGTARVLGLDPIRDDVEVKRRVGYVPDTPSFYEWMTVAETLAFVARYRKADWDHARAGHLLRIFDLPREQRCDTLSKGQRAKVSLVIAMAYNPELLMLDEATLGLDPLARRQFVEGLLAEYMEGDRTVFISSHLINEIAGIVDHVGILKDGVLIRTQPTEQMLGGMKRVRLIYPEYAPENSPATMLQNYRSSDREALAVVDSYTPEKIEELRARSGAQQVLVEELSLEEAFIEIAGRKSDD